jgi:hypothetical protein
MKIKTKPTRWIHCTLAALAVAGASTWCQAQSPIVYNFASDLQGWAGNEPSGTAATYSWNATGGSTGGGCMQVVFDGVTTTEMDPIVTLPAIINTAQYLSVTVHMKVDPNSGLVNGGTSGYGNLQAVLRDAGYSWDSMWFGTLYSPAANDWVTYTFYIAPPYKAAEKYLQIQFSASGGSTGPVTNYIDNVTITPITNPWVLTAFTDNSVIGGSWDSVQDAPFYNPVTHTGPTSFTPAGSWQIQIANPGGYNGWNQYQTPGTMDLTRFQYVGFDVYLDSSSGTTYGGINFVFFKNGWSGTPAIGSVSFNASMVGKWTHFDFPCAATGITASPAFVFQGAPGSDGGADTTTFHIDNVVFWNPPVLPQITGLSPGTPGGLQIHVDVDGTSNQYDQEGITSPATNNVTDLFWLNQTPATYAFTITNFPSPASAPHFDAHVYIVNGDTITANGTVGSWGYNQTYSGVPWNALDYVGMHVQNDTNGGVVAIFEWKTNSPSSNPNSNNITQFKLPSLASANGTWALNFSDNTHASISGPDGSVVGSVTLPDFGNDPAYVGNFSPGTSLVQFGLAKNDVDNTGGNNGKGAIFTSVLVTNMTYDPVLTDNFSGPGLNANNDWQIAEYWLDSANRTAWQPQDTAYWIKWNSTGSGWSVQSSSNLWDWADAGVSYTYVDATGTNTLGAVPSTNLPAGNAAFFRLTK